MSETQRCKRITKITEALTDQTINSYEEGRTEDFWDGVNSLQLLLDVKAATCGEHIE